MARPYHTGLIVGKFCPLHKGHLKLIRKAADQCDRVIIISYTSNRWYSPWQREQWFNNILPGNVKAFIYDDTCPDDDASPLVHSEFVANALLGRGTTVQAVFGAEAYVSGLAEYLESFFVSKGLSTAVAAHTYPRWEGWSGTEARKIGWSYHGHHPAVKQYGKERIALLGGESSGKTTLAEALSVKFNFSVAYEYGRELYEQRQGKLYYEDMYEIAKRQVDRENCLSSLGEVNYSVCDSTPLTTLWYATKMFDYPPDSRLVELATNRGYENVFICTNDFPFVQDGTRQNMEFAKEMFDYYKSAYPAAPILTGSVESRVNQVSQYLGVSND